MTRGQVAIVVGVLLAVGACFALGASMHAGSAVLRKVIRRG